MKKLASLTLAAVLSLSLLAGCAPKAPATDPDISGDSSATPTADAALTGTVSTNGSTSMEKVIGVLMEQFMAENKGVSVTYDPTGSGSGITAVSEGRADIGLSSRGLKDEEKATMTGTTLALDGIAIIVNNENTVKELTLDQITKIFTGEIANWKDVGGADGAIVLIGREGGSGTRDGFESITKTAEKCKYKQEISTTGGVIEAVKGNPNAIGYASLANLKDTIHAVSVDGVTPTEGTVQDGTYTVQRPFVLVTKTGTALSPAAQAFFDYMTGAGADELIAAAGAVPLAK